MSSIHPNLGKCWEDSWNFRTRYLTIQKTRNEVSLGYMQISSKRDRFLELRGLFPQWKTKKYLWIGNKQLLTSKKRNSCCAVYYPLAYETWTSCLFCEQFFWEICRDYRISTILCGEYKTSHGWTQGDFSFYCSKKT